ncbi:MAG: hypothetical protein LIO75_05895 [Lachnospiraceae bacterium]|nr:hypothetical protein [Lachnospiraceae bacterium]
MATVSMSGLASKYNNFMVPAMKIKVEGTDVVGCSDFAVESVEVVLSQEAASAATISLTGAYDLKNRKFASGISTHFILGSMVEIEMGYGSSLTSLFYGYIDEITYELGESPAVRVIAVDVRRLIMGSKKSNISHNVKSYSDAFNEVIKTYKAVYKKTSVDATEQMEVECIRQNGSDYEFITEELCKKGERNFFVHAGQVYFKELTAELFSTVEMEWASDFLSFQRRASFRDVVIRVLGQDTDKKEEVEAEVTVKADDSQKSLVQNEVTEMNADVKDRGEAQKIADYKADKEKKKSRQASGSCVGIPEILPGGYVKIKNGDPKLIDGTYYVAEARHTFGSDGYRTSFEAGGWKR